MPQCCCGRSSLLACWRMQSCCSSSADLLWGFKLHDAPALGSARVVLHHVGIHHDADLPELVFEVLQHARHLRGSDPCHAFLLAKYAPAHDASVQATGTPAARINLSYLPRCAPRQVSCRHGGPLSTAANTSTHQRAGGQIDRIIRSETCIRSCHHAQSTILIRRPTGCSSGAMCACSCHSRHGACTTCGSIKPAHAYKLAKESSTIILSATAPSSGKASGLIEPVEQIQPGHKRLSSMACKDDPLLCTLS
jgi:hypothetical protein